MDQASIAAERILAGAEALSWRGTPYVPSGRKKGPGGAADCLTLLAGIFEGAGLIERVELPRYSAERHFHHDDELYLEGLKQFCDEVAPIEEREPLMGDVLLLKFGRCYSHGAFVLEWPIIIHSFVNRICGRENFLQSPMLQWIGEKADDQGKRRPCKVFVLKRWT